MDNSLNANAPNCVSCNETTYMVLENENSERSVWHCKQCTTKTTKLTFYGEAKPVLDGIAKVAGLALSVFAIFHGTGSQHGHHNHFKKW